MKFYFEKHRFSLKIQKFAFLETFVEDKASPASTVKEFYDFFHQYKTTSMTQLYFSFSFKEKTEI